MKQLLAFPTWVLVKLMTPFLPKDHKWKNKKLTLNDWGEHSTDLNDAFSFFFWSAFVFMSVLISIII